MAQIINYENKTSHVAEIPEYWCAQYMPALPACEFNYGNLSDEDIATLMLYCGQSVRMDYGPIESGSAVQDVPEALRNYFGWEPEVRTMEREKYNDEHWNRMVKEEISKGHPLLYSAVGEQGWHAFVVDGFSDDLFHVNWGWDGYLDGFYSFQPLAQDHKSDFINMQWMVAVRDDDPSADVITYGTTIDGINYELMDDLTAVVLPLKDGDKYRGELIIPSHVDFDGNTYTVNYFGPNAFVNCEHLESISIPATIIGQEWSIFEGCENLHKVNVEDMAAFIRLDIGGLGTGSPLTYGADLYFNGILVKDLVIPEGIETIGFAKFNNCTSIESVTMPSTLKIIGQGAFCGCPKLKSVNMEHSSVETIGLFAFLNDVSIEEIKFPLTLKDIYEDAFGKVNGEGCKNLRKIVSLPPTPPQFIRVIASDKEYSEAFTELHFSEAVVYVPDESIEEYRQATEWSMFVDIRPLSEEQPLPETITISDEQLIYEINLTEKFAKVIGHTANEISLPASVDFNNQSYPVTAIGSEALYATTILKIDAPLTKIGMSAFRWGAFEERCELPSTLEYIPNRAFAAASIPYLILPESILRIGSNSFGNDKVDDLNPIPIIESRNSVPPSITEDTFAPNTYEQSSLMVPYGSKKAYASAPGWRNFKNISNLNEQQEQTFDNDLTFSASIPNNIPVRDKMQIKVAANVRNSGLNKTSGFILNWSIDNKYFGEKHYDHELNPEEIFSFDEMITINIDNVGIHDLKLIVSMVDADDQDVSDNTVNLSFVSFDKGYYRVSLFEQFTTEFCSLTTYYAPQIANGIQLSGKSDFLAQVTHHCGFYDDFLTFNHDYEWFYNDGGTFTPAIMINRTDINETGNTPVCSVPGDLERKIKNQAGICDALVSVYCDVSDNKVTVKTLLEKNEDFDIEAGFDRVTVFLLEDSIPSREQLDTWSDGYAEDYIHRNTVRKVLSGIWGDKIDWNGDMCALKYESDIDDSWNSDNLKAVAFIHRYNPESPIDCQVYTANSTDLAQYGTPVDDSEYHAPIIYADAILLNQEVLLLTEGETAVLTATILPEDATDKTVTWTSSDESVATVSAEGEVTAIKAGTATITAASSNGLTASCEVTVAAKIIEAYEIVLNSSNAELKVGESFTLSATVLPEDTTDKTVVWYSSNEEVATVDANGNVTAIAIGEATITATCGNASATCMVTVVPTPVESIIISETYISLIEGESTILTATVSPDDATDKTVTWTSSDESVATVSAEGEVTAIKAGTATITAASSNGLTATCQVTVDQLVIEMEAIILNVESLDLEVGDTFQLTAEIIPADATYQDLEWWVDDDAIATVDQNGMVTMLSEGETTVHVRSAYWNDVEASCHLNVSTAVEGLIEDNAPCDVFTTNGVLLKKNANLSEIDRLRPGIYIIRQGQKTTKLLK